MQGSKDSHKNNSEDDSNTLINTYFKKDKFHHHIYSIAFVVVFDSNSKLKRSF